jgi:hypothetical protein
MTAGRVEHEEVAIARQQCDKHISVAINKHATIDELLEMVFIFGPCQGLHSEVPA